MPTSPPAASSARPSFPPAHLGDEFTPRTTYLNTASHGLLPARTTAALAAAVAEMAEGRADLAVYGERAGEARAAYAGVVGIPAERVALGSSVAVHVALVAHALPSGAEVLAVDGDFASLVTPFAVRRDLKLRSVPLEELAGAVRPGTALVAVSAAQSADGRVADLAAVGAAARAHGARLLVDTTQSTGWLPLEPDVADYTVCGAYKWLLCPRGVSFLTVPGDGGGLEPLHAGWVAGEDLWNSTYGPVTELARSARRFDESPPHLPYLGAAASLGLVAGLGVEAIGRHNRALAARFRAGVAGLGRPAVPADSPIVAVPGLGAATGALAREGIRVADRAGHLRAAFHLYNTDADVDRLLEALAAHVR
ncbi:aminotransferase class V-fold PLP-dependent enzyme [Streptomyces sp. TRM 70351]|uniref:aminotransferase class V-fold PLP-dependent enzyme n=1 Tax=Streptomyces sp. TRM 70351 TaxID=3116552 RepID=UPI002E7C235A|nr:aminotransferase class V-fold PLP-dependent enzyme [Streptomyces sp. TRM 70351]MEE1930592.1 aminotransferase class V-fold PLP-dependent enzyme [Streptomyces sp. TRM 70351]